MRHLIRNIVIILAVLGIAGLSVYPPEKNLRLGKDLAGGVSLVYTVDLGEEEDPAAVDRVIQVLQERVNPRGLYEISFVRQGRDRVEVTMPLPSERVQRLRDTYEAEVEAFGAFSLDDDAFLSAMRASGDERRSQLEALMDSEPRRAVLGPVLEAVESAEAARSAYESRRDAGAEAAELDALLEAAAEAELALDSARATALSSVVSPIEVRDAVQRSDEVTRLADRETDEVVEIASPRERAIEALTERLEALPGGVEQLETTLAAYESYLAERTGLDDPDELKRLLQGAGVLEFRIAVEPGTVGEIDRLREQLRTRGPGNVESVEYLWSPLNKLEDWVDSASDLRAIEADAPAFFLSRGYLVDEFAGEYFMLVHDTAGKRLTAAEGDWALTRASPVSDQLGRPAVGFEMDPRGAVRLSELTEPHVNEPMAVLLDGRVYTAPNLISRLSDSARITGTFSPAELQYLIKTLNAGSLAATLAEDPISESTLSPELGADNLAKGMEAGVIALVLVGAFMVFYYFQMGLVAMVALACNAVIILGVMSLSRAAFTLPGIAGIILTFGMAVDANVLIYERIREELLSGHDLRTSVRVAYQKVLSTIVDANVTNLIVCFVLAYTATQEIKGFAITLGVGVVATMFSALLITRVIFTLLVDEAGMKKMSQLPIAVPLIHRIFEPKIDWIRLRPIFVVVSVAFIGLGISFMVVQRGELLDTEFRGGTAIDLRLKATGEAGAGGDPVRMTATRSEMEERLDAVYADITDRQTADPGDEALAVLAEIRNAQITAVNPRADGVTSDWFKIKTTISDSEAVRDVVVAGFSDVIDQQPPLAFRGSGVPADESDRLTEAPVYPIIEPTLGANIGRPEVVNDVGPYFGGVAIVLDEIEPAATRQSLESRLDYARNQAQYASEALRRSWDLIVLEGTPDAVESAVIVVHDDRVNALYDEDKWEAQLALNEWSITRTALVNATTLAGVQAFSPEIAATFRAQASVAVLLSFILITIYIWARFGSVRYSVAALACLVHDVIIAIGLIALAEILYEIPFFESIGIQPYRIDLGLVAAILTIIGYSLNDTIIILDRIRENRGKLAYASREVVNRSINQTISRTVITSGTTLLALGTMFVIGGEGIASFTYALICGVIIGTYSSIAVAAPLVYSGKIPEAARRFAEEGGAARGRDDAGALPAGS